MELYIIGLQWGKNMKYWKKNDAVGTMNDNGFVPDSQEATKEEYDNFVLSQKILTISQVRKLKLKGPDGKIVEYEIID